MEKVIKKPAAIILYNKKDITKDISRYLMSLTYADFEKGQSDELLLQLKDPDKKFIGKWKPQKGDKISAQIGYSGEPLLNCGTFTVNGANLHSDEQGDVVTINSLAASISQTIRQKNSKPFEGTTLIQIAKEVGARHGYKVAGSEGFIKLQRERQYDETDLAFLHRISSKYGYIFKLTDNIITFIKSENLENSKPLMVLTRKDIESLDLEDTATKTYTACKVQYFNPKTGKYMSYIAKSNQKDVKNDVLKLQDKCSSKEEAIAKAKAGLKAGQTLVEGSVSLKCGNRNFIAGANYTLDEYEEYNGKYHIKSSVHHIEPDNYTVSGEVYKIA